MGFVSAGFENTLFNRLNTASLEIVEKAIESIKTNNQTINAFSETYFDEALETASACDVDRQVGICRGPLHGIPFGVKDLFLTKDRRTARGSQAFRDFVPKETAPIVERIENAGAILIGKTTTTEFGWSGSSVSELYGPTRNPWNTRLTSGGSSSGSAAAIAAGMVPFALGSDGGGSVRIPASFCGVFAMKGSLGRIPAYPWSATEMLSHAGPMSRTAAESTLLFNVLKGPDARDHLALPDDGLDYLDADIDLGTLRIAYTPTLFGFDVDDEVSRVVDDSVRRLSEALDLATETIEPDWDDPIRVFETLWVAGRGIAYGKGPASGTKHFGAGFGHLVDCSSSYSLADYLDAMKARAQFASRVHQLFCAYDLLLLPTVPILPFDAERETPANMPLTSEALPWTAWTPFTYPFNLSGNPAASIPAGLSSSGLPIGLQVVGRRYADSDVLSFCRALEALAGFQLPPNGKFATEKGDPTATVQQPTTKEALS